MSCFRWSYLIAALCGIGSAAWGTVTSAFQFLPLTDDINTRHMHDPDAWVGGGFQSSGVINQSPAEFGPSLGMYQRSPDGYPTSGDSFPLMTPGPLPGGLSPDGFNGSGMLPPVNQPRSIMTNPRFGGNDPSQSQQTPFGVNDPQQGQSFDANIAGVNGQSYPNGAVPSGQNAKEPNSSSGWNSNQASFGSASDMNGATRMKPKVSWALDSAQPPYVGLLGQVARPGVYEIERQGTILSVLLQNVGGMAKDASGQFRVIRNGRPGQMTSYSGAAVFELMPGDLIIADALPQYGLRATQTSTSAIQVGFVNLLDRPVVLKLRSEHAKVKDILSIMRQDQSLVSQIKIVAPPTQRGNTQPGPDTILSSETVLIFPPNSVKTEQLVTLPEPFNLKREADTSAPQRNSTQPNLPQNNISPDVTQSQRSRPIAREWTDSNPLPLAAQTVSRPNAETSQIDPEVPPPPTDETASPTASRGVLGSPRRTVIAPNRIARDSNMPLAPPAEDSSPVKTDRSATDLVRDVAPIPELEESIPIDDDGRTDEPSLLHAQGNKRHIHLAKDSESNKPLLTSADVDGAESTADKASAPWSIWPPILTAGIGLLALIGFSLSLRRRTTLSVQSSATTKQQSQPLPPVNRNSQTIPRRELLDSIIDNQLPLTVEQVPLASPLQFHGRPQPPKTIRLDQKHALPKPHSPSTTNVRGQKPNRQVREDMTSIPESDSASNTVSQNLRVDQPSASSTKFNVAANSMARTSSSPQSSGPLDRALSAMQNQSARTRNRKERDA